MGRIIVVANKVWEADPLVGVLSATPTDQPHLPRDASLTFERSSGVTGRRGSVVTRGGAVEIWCLQELMDPAKSSSSSEEKARVLPALVGAADVALVVAFGTAATLGPESANGCAVIGTKTFVHDANPSNPKSRWDPPNPDAVVRSRLDSDAFARLALADAGPVRDACEERLLPQPLNPARKGPSVSALYDYVALSEVNITDYRDYTEADPRTVDRFDRVRTRADVFGSLESTHGVIRACTNAPFLFVSGITDRIGYFDDEVNPRQYAQNFVAAHNAGVAVAYLIPDLLQLPGIG